MTFIAWIKTILFRKVIKEECTLEEQRREIERLKKEVSILKEKFIVFPKRNGENITVNFYDENIEEVIIQNISEAKKELCIAVAWFTSIELINKLEELKRNGVNIRVIISDDNKNDKSIYKLTTASNKLKVVVVPMKGNQKYPNLMHNKYCIIDSKKVIDGSYNWTKKAKYNLEHIVIIEDKNVAKLYKDSFDKIFDSPKYYSKGYVNDRLG